MQLMDQTMIADLIGVVKYVQGSPDLELRDMPILASQAASLTSAVAAKMAALGISDQNQRATEAGNVAAELLTVEEAAKMLKVTPGWFYAQIREKKVPAVKLGKRQYRIRRSDLLHWNRSDSKRETPDRAQPKRRLINQGFSVDDSQARIYEERIRGPRQRQPIDHESIQ